MKHLLEKQFVVAFLCLSMAVTIPATRKEDLERAAELAVERAAERAAERAVEKALEAGNTTSTTITVKESYSNARKTAEEQAAPGSESTRHNNKETSIFETKDVDATSDFEPSLNRTEYTDYNESKSYDDEESSEFGDYNDSRDYSNSNDSISFGDFNESRTFKEYNEPRGFRNYNSSDIDYNDSKGYEVEADYSSFLNDTDYKKLNSSKSSIDPDITLPFGNFDWSSNDSNFRHGFGRKLSGVGSKLTGSILSEDISFYSAETDFLKKRNSKKEDVDEDDVDKDDSWKSYSDWKDFKHIDDKPFSKDDKSFLKGDESFTKVFWDDEDSPLKSTRPFWADDEDMLSSETKKVDKKESEGKTNPKEKDGVSSSLDKSPRKPSSEDYFSTVIKSWQPDDKNSSPRSKSYIRRSSRDENSDSMTPPYHKRLSRYNVQKKGTISTSERTTQRYSGRSENEYGEGSHERSKDRSIVKSKDESREDYEDRSFEQSKVRCPIQPRENKEYSYEKHKGRPKERRSGRTTEKNNIRHVSKKKEENLSQDVKTISPSYRFEKKTSVPMKGYVTLPVPVPPTYSPEKILTYKIETPPFNVDEKIPIDIKESRQPYTNYKIQKMTPVPVDLSIPVQLHENSLKDEENEQENHQGNYQGSLQGSAHVQFLRNLHDSLNIPTKYPFIPRTTLAVPKSISKEFVDNYHHEVPKHYSGQKIQKHQQVDVDDRFPMLIKMGVPGPFPIENENLQSEKPYPVPVKIHVENPYTIHLDKSIPLALKESIPFIIHVPLKLQKNHGLPEARYSTKYENVPTESQTLIKRIIWL